jgi:hypothetical protein
MHYTPQMYGGVRGMPCTPTPLCGVCVLSLSCLSLICPDHPHSPTTSQFIHYNNNNNNNTNTKSLSTTTTTTIPTIYVGMTLFESQHQPSTTTLQSYIVIIFIQVCLCVCVCMCVCVCVCVSSLPHLSHPFSHGSMCDGSNACLV